MKWNMDVSKDRKSLGYIKMLEQNAMSLTNKMRFFSPLPLFSNSCTRLFFTSSLLLFFLTWWSTLVEAIPGSRKVMSGKCPWPVSGCGWHDKWLPPFQRRRFMCNRKYVQKKHLSNGVTVFIFFSTFFSIIQIWWHYVTTITRGQNTI